MSPRLDYTPDQWAAIETLDDPLLIVACAGSGKTQVISQRVVEILRRPDVTPDNVVAFTFTDRAAAELTDRITTLVTAEFGHVVGLAEMFVGTMHGYALDVLQTHVPEMFRFTVLDEIGTRLLIDRNSAKSGLTRTDAVVKGSPRPLRRYTDSRLYMQVMNILREDDVDADLLRPELVDSLHAYRELLHEHNYLDYADLLRLAADMLARAPDDPIAGGLVRHVRDRVRYVVVDEYQDTNPVQEQLVAGLCRFGANLCVVGDDDQTIYQWRGSAVRNILSFAGRHTGVRTVTLDDNFRSSPGIVSLGRAIAERNSDARLPKKMVAAGHQDYQAGDLLALSFDAPAAEASWICDRIEALRGQQFTDTPTSHPRGLSWSDAAVLFRSVSRDAGPLVEEMRSRGIPYVIKGLTRLFEAPEVLACVTCFQYVLGEAVAADVVDAWLAADLGLSRADLDRGLKVLDEGRHWEPGGGWARHAIQRLYLGFLAEVGLREERVSGVDGGARGELAFYNLGKFSRAISDFEHINFRTDPGRKYESFVRWLEFQAPGYYAESDADVGYATPDAVTIATVHQAKGMQWPAVFVPALRRNRFPSKRGGGLNAFHVIPAEAVPDADRYRGTEADEVRLFYVAVTRAQKYLAVSYSPGESSMYRTRSPFFDLASTDTHVLTREPPLPDGVRLAPQARHEVPEVRLSFSELKYLFECPYQFKLRFLYGFDAPIDEALGYGKSVHDVLAEIHKRAVDGDLATDAEVERLVERHLNTPFANPTLRGDLRRVAVDAVRRYLEQNRTNLTKTRYAEQRVQVHAAPGIVVDGRIDLIRRLDSGEVSIVDFKSTERAQAEEVTRDQLHVYAIGYQELTGRRANVVEVVNLDRRSGNIREVVDDALISEIRTRVHRAGDDLRANHLPRLESWCPTCTRCDFTALCREPPP
ncbi:MAG TPA: ATP-dependent DNA helicase [Mycobacteriales bacterium]|nr:ATP-dependent DNA helicase [Mycobacteriales bacterium]